MKSTIEAFSKAVTEKSNGIERFVHSTGNTIDALESKLNIDLPEDVKELYSSFNGQEGASGIIMGFWLNSLKAMQEDAERLRSEITQGEYEELEGSPVGPVKPFWHHDKWIPLFGSDNQNISIDLDPADGGNFGQLVLVDYEDELRVVLVSGVSEFLILITDKIIRGELRYDEEAGGFYPDDEEVGLPELFGKKVEY